MASICSSFPDRITHLKTAAGFKVVSAISVAAVLPGKFKNISVVQTLFNVCVFSLIIIGTSVVIAVLKNDSDL